MLWTGKFEIKFNWKYYALFICSNPTEISKKKNINSIQNRWEEYIDLLVYSNFLLSVLSHNMYSKQSYVLCSLVGAVVYGSGHSAGGCCQFISDAEVGIMFKIVIVGLTLKFKKKS